MEKYIHADYNNGIDKDGNVVDLTNKIKLISGENILVFDSLSERERYINDMPKPFDLDGYKQEVNESHNLLFQSLYLSKNYLSIGEISLWLDNEEFGTEAKLLSDWWILTCGLVAEYLDGVTEQTIIENFIDTLPKL